MESLLKLLVLFLAAAVGCVLLALPTMLLWNWLMPEIFGLTKIGFWESLGLLFLTSFLFKGSAYSE